MIELERINNEIFIAQEPIVFFGNEEIVFLKQQAMKSMRRRARICAHQTNEDALHEMLIAITADSYIHPHKHINKSESFHIVEGLVDVVIFDDSGAITNIIALGQQGSGRSFYYRLSDSRFHTLIIHSDILVVHEVTNGPFDKTQTKFAWFAPSENDGKTTSDYMKYISKEAADFTRSMR
jgi:cupin fold WbuC family metalloprotein